jgi:hypothetical protein
MHKTGAATELDARFGSMATGHTGQDREDTGVFSIEEFRREPGPIIDRSIEGLRVVIESAPGRVAMVLSVGSFEDLEIDS